MRKFPTCALAATVIVVMLPTLAMAQDGEVLVNLEDQIVAATQNWESTVMNAATSLFWILAGIEVGIAAVWLAIQAPSLDTWFAELVRRIMFIGFFLFVLQQGPDFAWAVVDSLFQLGAEGGRASPRDTFNAGIQVASSLSENAKFGLWEDNLLGFASVIAMAIVVIMFALVAALFVAVLVEMYVGLLAGMIMLGLGGSSFTKDFAIRYLIYAFSVGMKLMGLVMIAKIGSDILIGLSDNANASGEDQLMTALTISGISVVVFMIALHVPTIIQGMVQGVSTSSGMEAIRSGGQVSGSAAVGAGMAAGGSGVVKGGMAAASAASQAGASRGAAAMAGLKAASSAVGSAAGDKLMGIPGAKMGSTLGLANEKLRQGNNPGTSPRSSNRKMDADS